MDAQLRKFLAKFWPLLVIVFFEIILFYTNYVPKTNLVGWDNLYPELDFGLNIKRTFFATWQEYRGLGYMDGISYAANLPHYLFLFISSFILPQNLLRYFYIFLMHLLGGVGTFLLLKQLLNKHKENVTSAIFPLIGSLIYQYNFAIIQMFYLPFELFMTHFAALPWGIYSLQRYLDHPTKKWLTFLSLISFLSTPQAHTPTIFIVYALALFLFSLFTLYSHGKKLIKPLTLVLIIVFCTNAFWGLPYIVSTINQAPVITQSKNNQMATETLFLKNHKFGDFTDTALMKGLSLDFTHYDKESQSSGYIFEAWLKHLNTNQVVLSGWALFILCVIGVTNGLWQKEKKLYPFVFLWLFAFVMLGNDIPLLGSVSFFLRTYVPYFSDIFRFVFTKFSILYALMYSVFVTFATYSIFQKVKQTQLRRVSISFALVPFVLLFIVAYPVFKGQFFYKNLRVAIPQEYFNTFKFFNKQDKNTRIAILPIPSYWAWTQTYWGSIGSGFVWYGLSQPVLDTAFTPWSRENENFYWETSQALFASDVKRLETVLTKYNVTWLLVDGNIVNSEKPAGDLNLTYLQDGQNISDKINFITSFNRIKIYKFSNLHKSTNFISLYRNVTNVGPVYIANDFDRVASESAVYATDASQAYDVYYPYRSLFSGKTQKDLEFEASEQGENLVFRADLPKNLSGNILAIPSYDSNSLSDVNKDNWSSQPFYPKVLLNGQEIYNVNETNASASATLALPTSQILVVVVPKVYGYYSYNSDAWNDFEREKKSCNTNNAGVFEHELLTENGKKVLRLTSVNSSNCLDFPFDYLPQRYSYLVTLETKNISGKGMFFSITNKQSDRTFLETYLDSKPNEVSVSHFIIPPMEGYSLGYSLNFDNISIGRVKTVNELKKITIHQIPYNFLVNVKLVKPRGFGALDETTTLSQPQQIKLLDVSHPNPAEYWVTIPSSSNSTLVLSQGYNPNWLAFVKTDTFPYFSRIEDHVLVNNWANGWSFDFAQDKKLTTNNSQPTTIYIVFWPQLLEFLGFILLPLSFLYALRRKSA